MPKNTAGQTNATAVAVAPKSRAPKGTKNFKVKNEKLGEVTLTVVMPEPSDADVNAYFGEGETGEANRAAALKKFLTSARSARIGKFLRDAEDKNAVTSDNALATFGDLKFGKRTRKAGSAGGRKVKRSSADLEKATAALGAIPRDADKQKEYLAKLLASLNIEVAAAEPEAATA